MWEISSAKKAEAKGKPKKAARPPAPNERRNSEEKWRQRSSDLGNLTGVVFLLGGVVLLWIYLSGISGLQLSDQAFARVFVTSDECQTSMSLALFERFAPPPPSASGQGCYPKNLPQSPEFKQDWAPKAALPHLRSVKPPKEKNYRKNQKIDLKRTH